MKYLISLKAISSLQAQNRHLRVYMLWIGLSER